MKILKQIPNIITLGNLLFGCLAVFSALESDFISTVIYISISALLDFFDGFAARLLNAQGPLGVQLDSLADMVSFGLTPAAVGITLLKQSNALAPMESGYTWLIYFPLLLTLASCYRLAKFNIDTRQSENFIGMPTPANAIFWVFLPFLLSVEPIVGFIENNAVNYRVTFYLAILFFSYLMISEVPLLSLKFKKGKKNG